MRDVSLDATLTAGVMRDADEPRTVVREAVLTAGGFESPATGSGAVSEIAGMVADDESVCSARLWALAAVRNGTG